jgi:hypothetical protein
MATKVYFKLGVNQRKWKLSPSFTKKAVSLRLFSAASFCIVSTGSHVSNGQIAAGLPPKSFEVNASTWNIVSGFDISFDDGFNFFTEYPFYSF